MMFLRRTYGGDLAMHGSLCLHGYERSQSWPAELNGPLFRTYPLNFSTMTFYSSGQWLGGYTVRACNCVVLRGNSYSWRSA
jgi:hypothetical protein